MKRIIACILFFLITLPISAYSKEYCKSAVTVIDTKECYTKAAEDSDKEVNAVYQKLLTVMKTRRAGVKPEEFENEYEYKRQIQDDDDITTYIIASQKSWLKYRDDTCYLESSVVGDHNGLGTSIQLGACFTKMNQERIKALMRWLHLL